MKAIIKQKVLIIIFVGFSIFILNNDLLARGIFLNGVDISSSKNQTLNNVNINISEDGTIFIEAPQYQVKEDNLFTPLGKTSQGRFYNDKQNVKEGPRHANSLVDPKTLPRYNDFKKKQVKERKIRDKDNDLDRDYDDDDDSIENDSGRGTRVKNKGNLIRQERLLEEESINK